MKKLSLILVAMFAAGFMMAQNHTSITSNGNYNVANTTQGTDNTAVIMQNGDGNGVSDPTSAAITQVKDNTASINQAGFRQVAWMYQEADNVGSVVQTGSWNGSGNYIGGNHNFTQVEQYGKLNNGNIKTLHDWNGTAANPLKIYQSGDQNQAQITSGWATSSNADLASITQLANNNKSTINQEGGDWNSATVIQYTNDNVANLDQTGSYLVASIIQTGGDDNAVNLKQTGGVATIYQAGEGNIVQGLLDQQVQDPWASFAGSTLNVTQLGQENTLNLKSTTLGATVDVFQNGMLNKSVVIQN